MAAPGLSQSAARYEDVAKEKTHGVTYTPPVLADFVAAQIVAAAEALPPHGEVRVLDPAIGQGQLVISLLRRLGTQRSGKIEIHGFETDPVALRSASAALGKSFPDVTLRLRCEDFLDFVLDEFGTGGHPSLFRRHTPERYDLIIANPPYVRTQVMGATQAQTLARYFGLTGRVDLYYAFLLGMAEVLKPNGVAGVIVSNRFMSTRAGAAVRKALLNRFRVRHVWDLGDTKLFGAAVLPAVLLLEGRDGPSPGPAAFSSIYATNETPSATATGPIEALHTEGVACLPDGRCFRVRHGRLETGGAPDGVWRIASKAANAWLATVASATWGTFADIGKIRVGVKTCADRVFIRSDWDDMPEQQRPELLRTLTTHHVARRFRSLWSEPRRRILYPHETVNGRRREVDLARYPRAWAYLERHRAVLESRSYVLEARRQWYEIWVPQDPDAWDLPKLVFRDIAERPTFWIDEEHTVVNGDCYWMLADQRHDPRLLWLAAAVGNSSFIEAFYDRRFHNKLYAGRRRFMTQYVEQFPLPDPESSGGRAILRKAQQLYEVVGQPHADGIAAQLDRLVWEAFGLPVEEIGG
jgi:adenine-specific DNA-methyltransferase